MQQRSGSVRRGIGARAWPAIGASIGLALAATPGGCAGGRPRPPSAGRAIEASERLAHAWDLAQAADAAAYDGRVEEAVRLYAEAVAYGPGFAPIWNNYGHSWYLLGNRLAAVEAYSKAAELEPSDPRPFTSIGHIYNEISWAEEALRYYELALRINPNHLEALIGAVRAAESMGRAEEIDLDRIRAALLLTADESARVYLQRRQSLVVGRLDRARDEKQRRGS